MSSIRIVQQLLLVVCVCTAGSISLAQTGHGQDGALSAGEKQWMSMIPKLLAATDSRYETMVASYIRTRNHVLDRYTKERVNAFNADALGFEMREKYATDRAKWKVTMRQLFRKCFITQSSHDAIVARELKQLDAELAAIDDAVLVAIGIDMEYSGASTEAPQPASINVERLVDDAMAMILPDFEKAYAELAERESIVSDTSTIAALAVDRALSEENGHSSWTSTLFGAFAGAAVQGVGSAMVKEESTLHEDFELCVGLAASNVVLAITHPERPAAIKQFERFDDLSRTHNKKLAYAIIKELQLDLGWAKNAFNDAASRHMTNKK